MMDRVCKYYDVAQDVLSAGEFVALQWRLLERACESIIKLYSQQDFNYFVSATSQLEPLLTALDQAVSEFKHTNDFWNVLTARSKKKPMETLKDQIQSVVYTYILESLKLTQCDDVKCAIEEARDHVFQLETVIYSLVNTLISERNDEAISIAIKQIQENTDHLESIVLVGGVTSRAMQKSVFRGKLSEGDYGQLQLAKLRERL